MPPFTRDRNRVSIKSGANVVALVLALIGTSKIEGQSPAASETTSSFHLLETTIDDIHATIRSGGMTCRELVELYLKRVAAYNHSGPGLNAVQALNPRALEEADRLDTAFKASGPVGPLHCIPVLVKDQLETADMPTTYGSAVFKATLSANMPTEDETTMETQMLVRNLKIETWRIERLIPYARNARLHSDAQVAQIAASIVEFGFNNPVLVEPGGCIIAGHGRVLAARKLG